MRLRDIFVSTSAAAVVAASLAFGSAAMAQEQPLTEPTQNTQEIQLDWSLDPLVPYGVIGGLGGAALFISIYGFGRRNRGSVLRGGAAVAITAALLNPSLHVEDHEMLPTEVAIVVDKSASQALDGRDLTSGKALENLLEQFSGLDNVNVRVIEADDFENGQAIDGTRLLEALNKGTAKISPAQLGGVILLTDGQVHDLDAARAPLNGAPVHALISGHEDEKDRRIVLDPATPDHGFVGEDVPVRFTVIDDGVLPGASGEIEVRITSGGELLSTRSVVPGETVEVTLNIPHSGSNTIEFEASALDGELTDINNRAVADVQGIRKELRVLMLTGAPHAGERDLRDILSSDRSVDLVHVSLLRSAKKEDKVPLRELSVTPLPAHEIFQEMIDDFDLVILDNYHRQGVLAPRYLKSMADYVKNGGAMLVMPGLPYATAVGLYSTPLRDVLPAAPTGDLTAETFTPQLTEKGERHPVINGLEGADIGEPDWGAWVSQVGVDNVEGDVVMQGAGERPLLILNREGEGRIALLTSPGSWLWERDAAGAGPSQELFKRVTHWLLEEPALEEEALRLNAEEQGKLRITQQTLGDQAQSVDIISPSGKRQTVELEAAGPGEWQAVIDTDELGIYRAEQGDKSAVTSVGTDNPKEFTNTFSTTELLRPLVMETGGKIARIDQDNNISVTLKNKGDSMGGTDWIGIQKTDASILKGVERWPLISGFGAMAGLLLLLGVMYGREGGVSLKNIRKKPPANDGPAP